MIYGHQLLTNELSNADNCRKDVTIDLAKIAFVVKLLLFSIIHFQFCLEVAAGTIEHIDSNLTCCFFQLLRPYISPAFCREGKQISCGH